MAAAGAALRRKVREAQTQTGFAEFKIKSDGNGDGFSDIDPTAAVKGAAQTDAEKRDEHG